MNINKKFKIANISFLSITIVFIVLSILSGVFSHIEKGKEPQTYKEHTDISYLINGIYTNEDNISFVSSEVNEIVVTIYYYNNDKGNRGTLDATKTTFIKTKDFSGQTVYGAFGSVEYVEENLVITDDKTTVVYTIDYQSYQTRVKNYVSTNLDPDTLAAGKLELSLVATSKNEEKKNALVSISLLEDVVTISISRTVNVNESILDSNYKLLLVGSLGCAFIGVCFAICLMISYKLSKMDKYERNLFVIFKLNKGILVESNLNEIENGFVVASFKELLKVQNSVSLPILYSKKDDSVRFVIKAGNSVYSYTIVK